MKLTNSSSVPVYTISGSSTARPLPEWLARKRKRSLKQDPEYANRVELLQDFEFEEASSCIRVSEDGDWLVSTGTYKPQIHVHYLPHLSLSYARHTNALNQTFLLLSSDYSKSLHLQTDRFLEFHTPSGCHYTTRIPRYGRDLKYDRRSAEVLVPAVGVNADGNGEVYRLNLDVGRYMRSYEVDVGGDDFTSSGGGTLQGGIATGSVNTAAIAEESHGLAAFGTSLGTVELWDSRSKSRVGILPPRTTRESPDGRSEITALEFHASGLTLGTGSSDGLVHLYDLRSPVPFLKKDQGYGYPIHTINFLTSSTTTTRNAHLASEPKILTSDKRIIKIWDARDGSPWTSVEPAVDINCVTWNRDSGMILTANEGRQQHSFFIPQLGPAPKWCSFLDNLVEEMAEDQDDPAAYGNTRKVGEVYDNYKFLTAQQLRSLNLDHLVGTTNLLRPYMHGYFVAQQLYEEARLISNPEMWQEQRQKSIREKIDKERESRIRGNKKVQVKVNKALAERMLEREEKNERRKAKRALDKANALRDQAEEQEDDHPPAADEAEAEEPKPQSTRTSLLTDPRFSALFQDEAFAVDETSHEFRALNASTKAQEQNKAYQRSSDPARRLTAAEVEQLSDNDGRMSSDSESASDDDDDDPPPTRPSDHTAANSTISTSSYTRANKSDNRPQQQRNQNQKRKQPRMHVSSSNARPRDFNASRARSFGARAEELRSSQRGSGGPRPSAVVGEKEVTFSVQPWSKQRGEEGRGGGGDGDTRYQGRRDRRSASGNTFRRM